MAIEQSGQPAFSIYPAITGVIGPIRPIDTTTQRTRVTLSGTAYSVQVQISNAQAVTGPPHLFIPPPSSFQTYRTATQTSGPVDIPGPTRWVRLVVVSGSVLGGTIEQDNNVPAGSDIDPARVEEAVDLGNANSAQLAVLAPTVALRNEVGYIGRNADALPPAFPQGLSVMPDLQVEAGIPSKYPGGGAGTLLNYTTGNPDGAMQLYKIWQTNELYLRGYNSAASTAGDWRTWSRLAHSGNIGAPFVLSASHPDYLLDNTGLTDVTAKLQTLLNAAGGQKLAVYLPAGRYLLRGAVTVPAGVTMYGEGPGLDEPAKGVGGNLMRGTILIMRGSPQIRLEGGAKFYGFTEYYDEQNFGPVADSSQPDGLSAFIEYPPTHLFIGAYNGAHISDILYLGGSHFASQRHSRDGGSNPEKFVIEDIYGMVTHTFLTLYRVSDIPRVRNVLLNPNSIGNFSGTQAKLDNFTTKTAKNAVLFRFASVDDIQVHDVFVYAFKTGVEWFISDFAGETGLGGGAEFVNFSLDGVAMVTDIARSKMNGFCLHFVNGFWTPLVKRWVEGTTMVPAGATPCAVRFRTGAQSNVVQISNINVYGQAVPQIADSGTRYTDFVSDGNNAGNIVQLSNYHSNSAAIMFDPAAWRLLPTTNTTLPQIQNNGVVFNDRHLPQKVELTGQFVGAAPSAEGTTVALFVAPYRGRLAHGAGGCAARVGPTVGGGVYLEIGGRRLGNFFWNAGATTGDPFFVGDNDPGFEAGETIRLFVANMAGAQDLTWHVPMEPRP